MCRPASDASGRKASSACREAFQQGFTAFRVDAPHLAHVPREMAFGDEPGQRVLGEQITVAIHQLAHCAQCRHGPARCHDVTLAQGRKQALGERADVEHRAVAIQRLQCVEWTPAVAKFTVVIVFDDHCALLPRKVEQGHAPRW